MANGLWEVIIPAAGNGYYVNQATNPSMELDITGWTASSTSAAIQRGKANAFVGGACLTFTPGSTGDYVDSPTYSSTCIYMSLMVCVPEGGTISAYRNSDSDSTLIGSYSNTLGTTDFWVRVETADQSASAAEAYGIRIAADVIANPGTDEIYLDALLQINCSTDFEGYPYFDGDTPGCEWLGIPHASKSISPYQNRRVGRIYNLDDLGLYLTSWDNGTGAGPITHKASDSALLKGAYFQGIKQTTRQFALVGDLVGSSLSDLQKKRAKLIRSLMNDLTTGDQPFILRYTGIDATALLDGSYPFPLEISAVYAGGLDSGDRNGFTDRIVINCIAYDPDFYAVGGGYNQLSPYNSTSTPWYASVRNGLYSRSVTNNLWDFTTGGMNFLDGGVDAATYYDGTWYYGGFFTAPGAYCYPFSSSGTGLNGNVYAIATNGNGRFYLGGAFTEADGDANCAHLCTWTSTGGFGAVGIGGANDNVRALEFDALGRLWVGGDFTTIGGAPLDYIGYYNGAAYTKAASTDMNGAVETLKLGADGRMYAGGSFTTAGGVTVNRVAYWDGTAWNALSTGATPGTNGLIYDIEEGPNGWVYVGGSFTQAGGEASSYFAYHVGSRWITSAYFDAPVHRIVYDKVRNVFLIGGRFTAAGSVSGTSNLAIWNGYTMAPPDIKIDSTSYVYEIVQNDIGDILIGLANSSPRSAGDYRTVKNIGKSIGPKLCVRWPDSISYYGDAMTIRYAENLTTGKRIYMDYEMIEGEKVEIDMTVKKPRIKSSKRGDVTGKALLRNSQMATFELLPGTNDIELFVDPSTSAGTIEAWVEYKPSFWSVDGSSQ